MALISFDAYGGTAYEFAGFDTATYPTWTHTASGRDRVAIVCAVLVTANGASNTVTATYGGVSMTLQGVAAFGTYSRLATFTLVNPATGAQTVQVNWSGLGGSIPSKQITCGSLTYKTVSAIQGFADLADNTGTSATSYSFNSTATGVGDFLFCAFARSAATAFSTFNGSARYSNATTYARLLMGDNAAGDINTVAFTATVSASDVWSASTLRLKRVANNDFFAAF